MNVFVQFTTIGTDAGPFNLYSNVDGFNTAFETGVTSAQLLAGFPSPNAPNGTTIVRAKSFGVCTNQVDILITGMTTTTTTSISTTAAPSMVFPARSCCNGITNGFIPYNPMYVVGNVLAVTQFGIFDGFEITGPAVPGVPDIVLYDGFIYAHCPEFLAFWAGTACDPFP